MENMNNEEELMLCMHDIHKSFGDLEVLRGIDLEVLHALLPAGLNRPLTFFLFAIGKVL